MFYDVKNLARLRRGRANPTSTKTHCCSRAREPGAMERSPRRSSRGAPPTAARGASLAGLPPAISVSPRSGQGRRESRFQARLVSLKDGRGLPSLYWFLDFKMGGERRSDGAQGGNRGMRRRVVGDAGPRLLLGNRLLSPRPPPGLFVPLTVGVARSAAPGDMPVRFKVRPGVFGPEGSSGDLRRGGCGARGPRWLSVPRPSAPQSLPATLLEDTFPSARSLSAHTHS